MIILKKCHLRKNNDNCSEITLVYNGISIYFRVLIISMEISRNPLHGGLSRLMGKHLEENLRKT